MLVAGGNDASANDPWVFGTAANARKLAAVESLAHSTIGKCRASPAATLPRRQKRPTLKPTSFPGVLVSDAGSSSSQRIPEQGLQQLDSIPASSSGVLHSLNLSECVVDPSERPANASSEGSRRNKDPRKLAHAVVKKAAPGKQLLPKGKAAGVSKLAIFDPGF